MPHTPPLLLLLNASADRDALVRSGQRRVLRWVPEMGGAGGEQRAGGRGREEEGRFSGDLADPATYGCAAEASAVTAVIDLPTDAQSRAALRALRTVRPDAAVLVLSETGEDKPGDGTLVRGGSLRDVLRLDLEEELQRLEAERRAYCLRRFAEDVTVLPILVHPDPDPDALSSAYALRLVLGRSPEASPLVTLGGIRRPENRRMAQLLSLSPRVLTPAELAEFEKVLAVDTQPAKLPDGARPRWAVVDHHPPEADLEAEFLDIRPHYGAAASMATEYLRAVGESAIGAHVATALVHGIRTDTAWLSRGVSTDDVQAYAFLQERADQSLLDCLQKPGYPLAQARRYGQAIAAARAAAGIVLTHAGELDPWEVHLLPEIADFCLSVDDTSLAVATGFVGGDLVFTVRHAGQSSADREGAGQGDCTAGELARAIAARGGRGGGHASMARAALPRAVLERELGNEPGELRERLLSYVRRLAAECRG